MTKEEAIKILRESRITYIAPNGRERVTEALDMAIRALKNEQTECDNNHDCEHCDWTECPLEVEKETDGDLISRQSVITMLNKIENAVEDGDGFQFNEWVEYAKDIPSAEKTDGDLISKIDKLPRIKVGNSNSPTVKYCIDEVLLYELLENYKGESEEEE